MSDPAPKPKRAIFIAFGILLAATILSVVIGGLLRKDGRCFLCGGDGVIEQLRRAP